MSQMARRDFLKLAGLTGGVAVGSALLPTALKASAVVRAQANSFTGRVFISKAGLVDIHTYVAPEFGVRVTSHIIETANQLVLIDTQLIRGAALEIDQYIESLGKPLDRIYISHAHPDHWAAAENFDVPLVSSAGVVAGIGEYIETTGTAQLASLLPEDQAPQTLRSAEVGIETGSETIDGVTFEYDVVLDAESPEQVVIRLPEAGVVVLQDLLFNNTHMYPLGNHAHWIELLNEYRAYQAEGYDTLLAGHGIPTTFGEIDAVIDYLNTMDEIIETSDTSDDAIAALLERYPNHNATFILDLFVPFRYQG